MDERELDLRHIRGMWSVTGRGISAVAHDRAEALLEWARQAGVSFHEPPAPEDVRFDAVAAGMSDPDFWTRFLH